MPAQTLGTAWNLFQRVAADLLDRLAFVLGAMLAARHTLFSAALERRYFVSVFLKRALLALGVVPWIKDVDVFIGQSGQRSFGRRQRGARKVGIRRPCGLGQPIVVQVVDRLGRDGHNRVRLLRDRYRREVGALSLGIGGTRLEVRGGRRLNAFFGAEFIDGRRFRNGLAFLGARLNLAPRVAMAPAASLAVGLLVLLSLG